MKVPVFNYDAAIRLRFGAISRRKTSILRAFIHGQGHGLLRRRMKERAQASYLKGRKCYRNRSLPGPYLHMTFDIVNDLLGPRTRTEDLGDAPILERRDVLIRDDSTSDHQDVPYPSFLQELHHPGK